jgi:glycosyltransferase involved in cell wall biosynthesis
MFSIYILTHNEEVDIAACIESAQLSDDVIVVDSYSSDRTIAIAEGYNVRVVQHEFESHGKQRTWMLSSVPTKYEWVYLLEADERMTSELFQLAVGCVPKCNFYRSTDRFLGNAPCTLIEAVSLNAMPKALGSSKLKRT